MKKKSIIVGHQGQDGRLLERLLLEEGGSVLGVGSRGPVDVRNFVSVASLVKRFRPDEVYYLASYQHSSSDRLPGAKELHRRSWETNVLGLVNFLESLRLHHPDARLFYASSSRVFGDPDSSLVSEKTPLAPNDAYGISKAAGMLACGLYRRQHGLFASVGILFNHESPGRNPRFVSGKIARAAAAAKNGIAKPLILGRLDDRVDWGYAGDYVEAMRKILRHRRPDDFVVSSGRSHSVRDFAAAAFSAVGLDWRSRVRSRKSLVGAPRRPLVGDHRKLTRLTGWKPKTGFTAMVRAMVNAELTPRGRAPQVVRRP